MSGTKNKLDRPLKPRELELFNYIQFAAKRKLPCPSYKELADRMGGIKPKTVSTSLSEICRIGYLTRMIINRKLMYRLHTGEQTAPSVEDCGFMVRGNKLDQIVRPRDLERIFGVMKHVHRPVYWKPRTCQWIYGEPAGERTRKCGLTTVPDSSYCEAHHSRAWRAS